MMCKHGTCPGTAFFDMVQPNVAGLDGSFTCRFPQETRVSYRTVFLLRVSSLWVPLRLELRRWKPSGSSKASSREKGTLVLALATPQNHPNSSAKGGSLQHRFQIACAYRKRVCFLVLFSAWSCRTCKNHRVHSRIRDLCLERIAGSGQLISPGFLTMKSFAAECTFCGPQS